MKRILSASIVTITFGSVTAYANISDFQLNGFLSVGSAWSDVNYLASGVEPTYISHIRKRPSFEEDTNVGLQISKQLREDVSITTQLLAEAANEWAVEATWAFIKWEPADHWQFRVGRVRTDPYMLSDYVNVGYAYPWVRPPEEVYSQIPSTYSNFTGGDIRYRNAFWHRDFTISGFYGAATTHLNFPAGPSNTILDTAKLRLRDLVSFNMKYGDEVFSVRAGFETTRATLSPNAGSVMQGLNTFLNALVTGNPIVGNILTPDYINYFSAYNARASFMGVGYQFDWNNIVSMGELVKRKADTPIIASAIGWYLMGGYRVKQLLPHVTFARERLLYNKIRRFNSVINAAFMSPPGVFPIFVGANSPVPLDTVAQAIVNTSEYYDGGAGSQSSVTLGLRWDVIEGVAIKAEYKHVHPDLGSPGLFDYDPHKSVNIYSLAVDAVM